MVDLSCVRCRHFNRSPSRYCVTCGCRVVRSGSVPVAPVDHSPGGVTICWVLFFTFLLGVVHPPALHRSDHADSVRRAHGLIYDFPPEYQAGHFVNDFVNVP